MNQLLSNLTLAGTAIYALSAVFPFLPASSGNVKIAHEVVSNQPSAKVPGTNNSELKSIVTELGIKDDAFVWATSYILQVEGGLSNHPNDRGGLTKWGIIADRARMHGLTIAQLTKRDAIKIYYTDYWVESGAHKAPTPLNMAIYNSYVNSGRRWRVHGKTPLEQALNYLEQQNNYYKLIIRRDPSQAVFGKGWSNRTEIIRNAILSAEKQIN